MIEIWLRLMIIWFSMICLYFWSIIVVSHEGRLNCLYFIRRLRWVGFCLCWCCLFTHAMQVFGLIFIWWWLNYGYWVFVFLIGVLNEVYLVMSVDMMFEGLINSLTIRFRLTLFANCWSKFGYWSLRQYSHSSAPHSTLSSIYFAIKLFIIIWYDLLQAYFEIHKPLSPYLRSLSSYLSYLIDFAY